MDSDGISFVEMDETGKVVSQTTLKTEYVLRCPGLILDPAHYYEDGSCRHKDPNCEQPDCTNPKFMDEIYCKDCCAKFFGEDYVEAQK